MKIREKIKKIKKNYLKKYFKKKVKEFFQKKKRYLRKEQALA